MGEEESGTDEPSSKELKDKYRQLVKEDQSNLENEQSETQVFYLKMCGDYYRYLAEFSNDEKYNSSAEEKYTKALELAKEKLAPTHPTRLGLALNASVCYYEIIKNPTKACKLAKD